MVEINNLPDEILVLIFTYLTPTEFFVVEQLSLRFNRILTEKRIIGKLDFRRCFNITAKMMSKFFTKTRCVNITEVNFNGCSWLHSKDFETLKKLKHLTALHLLRCNITSKLVVQLICGLTLQSLSFSCLVEMWRNLCFSEKELQDKFKEVKKLVIEISSPFHLNQVLLTLKYCPLLVSLNVREATNFTQIITDVRYNNTTNLKLNLPHLRECKFFLRSSMGYNAQRFIFELLSTSSVCISKIEGFWTSEAGCNVLSELRENANSTLHLEKSKFVSLNGTRLGVLSVNRDNAYGKQLQIAKDILRSELTNCKILSLDTQRIDGDLLTLVAKNCRKLECLSLKDCQVVCDQQALIDELVVLSDTTTKLTELSLLGTHIHTDFNPCDFIGKFIALRSLSISPCLISSALDQNEREETQSNLYGRRRRIGIQTTPTDCEILSSRLFPVTNCAKLEILIIKSANDLSIECERLVNAVNDKDLFCIAKLKQLHTLELNGLCGIRVGNFLPNICASCPLRAFLLSNIGPKSCFNYFNSLIESLNHCKMLEELRIDQKYDLSIMRLWDSKCLSNCKKLQILWVICELGSNIVFNQENIIDLVQQLENLVCFGLVQAIPKKICAQLSKKLRTRLRSRPAFKCLITNKVADVAKHDDECLYEIPRKFYWDESV